MSYAEGQFDVVKREIGVPRDWADASPFFPQQKWVDLNDGNRGLCIMNKGLPEYEVYNDEARTVAITLLRCVGRLSGGEETPGIIFTPEAQCLGEYAFEYALYPHRGDWEKAEVWKQAHQHSTPLLAVQTGEHRGSLSADYSFIRTGNSGLIISATKKAEDNQMLIIRVFNITSKEIKNARLRLKRIQLFWMFFLRKL